MTALAHPRKQERENDSEKDVKASRLQWKRFIIVTFYIIAALRFTFWIRPEIEAYRTGNSSFSQTMQATMARCPTFSEQEQSCQFASKAIAWASTGTEKGLLPCILPLPVYGNYTLWQGDGSSKPTIWTPSTPLPIVNVYGFQAPKGETRKVVMKLVHTPGDCHV